MKYEIKSLSETENDIRKTAKGAEVMKGLLICGSSVDGELGKVGNRL